MIDAKIKEAVDKQIEETIKRKLGLNVDVRLDRQVIVSLTWNNRVIKQSAAKLPKSTVRVVDAGSS